MIELRTLGTLDLSSSDPAVDCRSVLRQPKRLALLVYLASAPPRRFHRRDTLLAMFWPDLDAARGRAALRRALYFLRTALGSDVIAGRGDEEVAVDETRLWFDARAFVSTLRADDAEAALALYGGALLEGFFVSSAPEFERWLAEERRSLRTQAAKAAWALADARQSTDPREAITWAERAVRLAPFEEEALRRLMALQERLGDRTAALVAYQDFATRLADEFDLTPSEETVAMAERLRTSVAPEVDIARVPVSPNTVAVLPFVVAGPARYDYLREGMVDLLSTKLDGTLALRVVDPRALLAKVGAATGQAVSPSEARRVAAHFGAEHFLLGSIVVGGEHLQLTATLYSRDGEPGVTAEASGEGEAELFDLVDELARQILVAQSPGPRGRVARLAARSTRSLPALKHLLQGEHAFRAGRYFEAITAFQEATHLDPGAALAHSRLGSALAACAMPDRARDAVGKAVAGRDRLSPHDQMLLDAQAAWLAGRADQAERHYTDIVARYPDSLEAWYLLGDLGVHHNPYRGRSMVEARQALERALELDPEHVSVLGHLARIAALDARVEDVDRLVTRSLEVSPAGDQALAMRALRAFARRDREAEEGVLGELQDARALTIGIAFSDVALYSNNVDGTERFAHAFTAVARSPELQAVCHLIDAHLAVVRGQSERAWEALDRTEPLNRAWALEIRGFFAALPFVAWSEDMQAEVAATLEAWDPSSEPPAPALPLREHDGIHPHLRLYLLGLIETRLGHAERAAHWARSLEDLPVPPGEEAVVAMLRAGVEARLAWHRGDPAHALALLERARGDIWFQRTVASPFYGQVGERFLRAEALRALGREQEAAGWYRSMVERSPFELPFRPLALWRLGQSDAVERWWPDAASALAVEMEGWR